MLNITNRDALQEFLGGDGVNTGSNLIGSPSFAYGPDGTSVARIARPRARLSCRCGSSFSPSVHLNS
jgi:hypothetical protein